MKNLSSLILLLLLLVSFTARANDISEIILQYQADKGALSRKYTLIESVEYYDRMDKLFTDWLGKLEYYNFSALNPQEKVDFVLFKNFLEREKYILSRSRKDFDKVKDFARFADPLIPFITNRRRGDRPDPPSLAAIFNEVKFSLKAKRNELERERKALENWQIADKASAMIKNYKQVLAEAYNFYDGYDPDMTWWVYKPFMELSDELDHYSLFLTEYYDKASVKDDGSGIIGRPIGREALIKGLGYEFIPYSPEELVEIAEKEFAWSEMEMKKASHDLGFGDDWKLALEYVKGTYFPIGEWPQEINRMAEEAVDFVASRDLITIPEMAKETWRMRMLTAEEQKFAPFFLGGESILIAYPTHAMTHEEKMMSLRGNNPYFSRAVVHHELIPGHHLQQFMNQRYKPYRSLFRTPFWTEGWALYWEMNLWNKGFASSPEEKVGMLFWRMHRSARIIFSLNYHLGNMTPQESIDFLVDKVGHERANAEAEVRRSFTGNYGPLYQIAYMTGGLQFMGLMEEMIGSGKLTEKEFHDQVMSQNSIPVALLRVILNQDEIQKDYKSDWKFYNKQ